jgi:hypothetical protein
MRFLTMIGIAAGIPYAWFNEHFGTTLKSGWQSWNRMKSSSTADSDGAWPVPFSTSASLSSQRDPNTPVSAPSVHDLRDVLRFDVTPQWVTENWDRVSTVRAERDLVGMRVPLVTGTTVEDFAGSLTYYFDAGHRLKRLTLHGQTGSDRAIVAHVTQAFGMRPEPHLGAGMYLLRWNAKPMNVLRITHAPVIRADEPFAKLIVEMEINDVHGGYGVSPEFAELLVPDQHVRRWGI